MAIIRVPHLGDNYYEIVGSFPSISTIVSAIFDSLEQSLENSFRDELANAKYEEDMQTSLQVLSHFQHDVGPQYVAYAYLLMVTATIEKNNRVLSTDGFKIAEKREPVHICRERGILNNTMFDNLDNLVFDLFELRNFVAHSFGRSLAEPSNGQVARIVSENDRISMGRDGELRIDRSYLDDALALLRLAYKEIAKAAYPT